jgi:putative tryptophan/tyrosine transport system substrate-binding protein
MCLSSPMLFANRKVIFSAAAQARLPASTNGPIWPRTGLIAYGPPQPLIYRQFVRLLLVKALNEAKPSDVPVEQPTTFELVINLKTAKTLRHYDPDDAPFRR